jgi:hypothetical protein
MQQQTEINDEERQIELDISLSIDELKSEDFFTSEKWHKPYAEALMETDPVRLEALIIEAEDAISNRYLELCISPAPIGCRRDLQNAISVLMELRNGLAGRT